MGGGGSKQATNLPKLSDEALAQHAPFKIGEPIYDINHHIKKNHPPWEFTVRIIRHLMLSHFCATSTYIFKEHRKNHVNYKSHF
jgi:hypothetical protein